MSPPARRGEREPAVEVDLSDTHEHAIRVDYVFKAPLLGAGVELEWQAPAEAMRDEAVRAAESSDVVLAFVGISPNLEGEEMPVHVDGFAGGDRTDIDLPKVQQELLEAVAATGKPVVVVLMSGSAMAMNWAKDHAAALLEAWYPGEAGGEAIADVVTGKANPSGRLPITFYVSAPNSFRGDECYRDVSTAIANRIGSGSSTTCALTPDENHFAILRRDGMGVDWVPFVDQRGDTA